KRRRIGQGDFGRSRPTFHQVTVALFAATLVVLQTHVLFERDRNGKIHIKIEKKPTRESLLKDLVQKLFGFVE
ncbi:MAG: hypothetical protein WA746_02380, partial [Isosphaeraceae bacterium]